MSAALLWSHKKGMSVSSTCFFKDLYHTEEMPMTDLLGQIETELSQSINRLLPSELYDEGDQLAYTIAAIIVSKLQKTKIIQTKDAAIIVSALSGKSVASSHVVVCFGVGEHENKIMICNISAEHMIQGRVQITDDNIEISTMGFSASDDIREKLRLIGTYHSELRLLEEQVSELEAARPIEILAQLDIILKKLYNLIFDF